MPLSIQDTYVAYVQKRLIGPLKSAIKATKEFRATLLEDFCIKDPLLQVVAVQLPIEVIQTVKELVLKGEKVPRNIHKEKKRVEDLVHRLQRFYSGTTVDNALFLFQYGFKAPKKFITCTVSPLNVFHSPIAKTLELSVDKHTIFSQPIHPVLKGVISKYKPIIHSMLYFYTDCAMFLEITFSESDSSSSFQFNTARNLRKNMGTLRSYELMDFALFTTNTGFFGENEKVMIVSVVIPGNNPAFTGVKFSKTNPCIDLYPTGLDLCAHTSDADLDSDQTTASQIVLLGGSGGEQPAQEQCKSTTTDASLDEPDHPQPSSAQTPE